MKIRDRIRALVRVPAHTLLPNPRNWRTHPRAQQAAMEGMLAEIGFAGALLARELEDGSLELIDGHLRAKTAPHTRVPVLVLDVTAEEADKLLALFDPLAAMAGRDERALAELLEEVETDDAALQQLLDSLSEEGPTVLDTHGEEAAELEIPPAWQLLVECADEADQRQLYARLQGEGYRCRVLTL